MNDWSWPFPPAWTALGAVMLVLLWQGWQRRRRPMRVVHVVDGDTLVAVDRKGVRRKLRLAGVDSPELEQRSGDDAKRWVEAAVLRQWVGVRLFGRDRHRRWLATVECGHGDLAHALVRHGWAFPLAATWRLGLAGLGARLARRGVWRAGGEPKPWRARSRRSWLGRVLYRRR